jgi:hypothetical protein
LFIIPPSTTEPHRPDLLARACDPCYSTVFPPDTPAADIPSPTTTKNSILRAPLPSVNILSSPSSPPSNLAFRQVPGEDGIPTFSLSPEEPTEEEKWVKETVVGSGSPRKERETARGKLEAVLKR